MFWKIFLNLCNENNESPNTVCANLKLSNATATKWKSGAVPRETTLLKIANYFNVTVEYLLGETDTKTPPADADGDTDDWTSPELIKLIKELPKTKKSELEDYVRYLHAKVENERNGKV